jgi:type II secretory pathway pseudopilin PulG
MLKKGAMFGLDARIALAIFGALSVISGAALYSAIQQAKVVAVVSMMNEFAKAYEQYALDTGLGMPAESTHAVDVSAQELVDNTVGATNWNGPYLPYPKILSRSLEVNTNTVHYAYYLRAGIEDWDATTGDATTKPCDGTRTCYAWVSFRLDDSDDKSMLKGLDEYIDNSDGFNTGKLRYTVGNGVLNYVRFLIGPSIRQEQS